MSANARVQEYQQSLQDCRKRVEDLETLIRTLPLEDYRFRHFAVAMGKGNMGGLLHQEQSDHIRRGKTNGL